MPWILYLMYTETKVLLSIALQGGTLVRESKITKIEWALTLGDVKGGSKKKLPEEIAAKVVRRGRFKHHNLVAKPAIKSISLGREAYAWMTSADSFESWMFGLKLKKKDWKNLSAEQRLKIHLQRLCEHYGGKSFTYQIMGE
ncbi:hypothetical protein KNV38_gp070 [uncultured phage cr111_1]|uniref:Uncharacterized protein n=1 Tax=uncultured phage cr111_1 TaxID=2772071 RepID=A0A7M1S1I2_9CAUD|nr:hypothetical protein KNV38_gp070 [uncultured phage cr111_1]QOR59190.1 hypothetical protein [uncultured phage cr111_1]